MKIGKGLSVVLSAALLSSAALTFSASAATASFTPTKTNFRPVFDFDATPSTYTDQYKPGTRSDTVGDSKSQKSITAEGLGLTFNLTIDKASSFAGNALRLDVTALAPPDGSWCPVMLNVMYGKNKLVDVSGATDFVFWVDTTKYKDTNGANIQKGINLYVQETDIAKDGTVTKDATAWKPKSGEAGGYYFMEDGKGGWTKVQNSEFDFWLPANYKGWIKLPLSTFTHTDWSKVDSDGVFNGKQIQIIQLGMGNYAIQSGATLYFDEFGFVGNFKAVSTTTTTKQGAGSTASTTKAGAGNGTTAATDANGSQVESTDSAVSTADTQSSDVTGDSTSASDINSSQPVDANDKDVDNGASGGLWWLWVIAGVVVVAAAGVGVYFFYFKKKQK